MILPKEVNLLAGTDRPVGEAMQPFAPQALDFLDALSRALRACSTDPETAAFAFWCRRAHLRSLQKKHGIPPFANTHSAGSLPEGQKIEGAALRLGRGRIFHLAPANVPMMFAYTWAIGLLAGNAGIVRISERTLRLESVQLVLHTMESLFAGENGGPSACYDSGSCHDSGCEDSALASRTGHGAPASDGDVSMSCTGSPFEEIRRRTSFITYDHSDAVTEEILSHCDGRVLWGGDETIRRMRQTPMPAHAIELAFPDRVSLAVIDEEALQDMQEEDLRNLVHRFYNDTYVMDQNGCSSPQTVLWLSAQRTRYPEKPEASPEAAKIPESNTGCPGKKLQTDEGSEKRAPGSGLAQERIREKWWKLLAREAEQEYENDGFRAARKLERAALAVMRGGARPHREEEKADTPPASLKGRGAGDPEITAIRRFGGNALYVLHLARLPEDLAACKGGFGLFYEAETDSPEKIFQSFSDRIQTIVCIGIRPDQLAASAMRAHSPGVLRFVEAGQALQMDTFWDGMDLIEALSRRILL